jgi:hypothetical protein
MKYKLILIIRGTVSFLMGDCTWFTVLAVRRGYCTDEVEIMQGLFSNAGLLILTVEIPPG